MLHLLRPTQESPLQTPLSFGPPILNAFSKVAAILGRAVSPPLPFKSLPKESPAPSPRVSPVAPPRVSPVAPPRVPTIPLAQSVQHDPTIAGTMYDPITGCKETIDSLLHGPDKAIWLQSLANECGRCTQGLSKQRTTDTAIIGNRTMFFIKPHEVPPDRKVTYANFVCTMRLGKTERYRICMTVGGDHLDAYQDVRSPAVSIIDTKLHINSTISDAKHGARYCTADLKDFFLTSDMKIFQYMRIHRRYLPQEVIDEYALTDAYFDSKGYVYLEIRKGMYGLKEASILAYDQLKAHLAPYGYSPV